MPRGDQTLVLEALRSLKGDIRDLHSKVDRVEIQVTATNGRVTRAEQDIKGMREHAELIVNRVSSIETRSSRDRLRSKFETKAAGEVKADRRWWLEYVTKFLPYLKDAVILVWLAIITAGRLF